MRWLVVLLVLVTGCRGCTKEEETKGPPMPKGMLVPAPSGSTAAVERGDYALHHEPLAGGVEIVQAGPTDTEQGPPDAGGPAAVYLSLDAMTVFHDAFARAYQAVPERTFDLFLPRIVDGHTLAAELRALLERLAPSTVRDAIARAGAELIQFSEARGRVWVFTL